MLEVLNVIIYALIVLISVVLIVLILIQPSKGGGLGTAFGGIGENVFGAHAMEHLSKVTVWLISIFFVLTLVLTVLSAHASKSDETKMANVSVEESIEPAKSTPAEVEKKEDAKPAATAEVKKEETKAAPVAAPAPKEGEKK